MNFVRSGYSIIDQEPGLLGIYKQIEKAARVSYKSEDKITDGSAEIMVKNLIASKHYACLEHGTVYLYYECYFKGDPKLEIIKYSRNPYSRVVAKWTPQYSIEYYITTNYRVIIENGWENDLEYMCEPTEYHEKRYSVKFITSIGISREILRHRVFSFINESTRYCNYSKGRFGSSLTFVVPQWIYKTQERIADSIKDGDYLMNLDDVNKIINFLCNFDKSVFKYRETLEKIEENYLYLTTNEDNQLKPQEARSILPMDTKSELFMTGFASDWIHFFKLRSYIAETGKPHPDVQILADGLLLEFLKNNYIKQEDVCKDYKKN